MTESFGALGPIYGTLVTSAIAMTVGIPISFGIAVFIAEICPPWLKRPLGMAIELLAGIPSIIFGIWGLFVLAPFMQSTVQPALIATLGAIPGFGVLFQGPPYGIGVLTAGLILAIMVLPFITSISRDVFDAVPPVLTEAAYAQRQLTPEQADDPAGATPEQRLHEHEWHDRHRPEVPRPRQHDAEAGADDNRPQRYPLRHLRGVALGIAHHPPRARREQTEKTEENDQSDQTEAA